MTKNIQHFSTKHGVVTLSEPFFTLINDQKQINVTYTPNNNSGWGVCKSFDVIEIPEFSQHDAELFACTGDSMLGLEAYVS